LAHNREGGADAPGRPHQQVVCDQDRDYRAEQLAFDGGAMGRLVEYTETTVDGGQSALSTPTTLPRRRHPPNNPPLQLRDDDQ